MTNKETIHQFEELLHIIDKLLGPEGCPWDRKQTLETLRSSIIEEVSELIEAVDLDDDNKILEELGDVFFNTIFFCKVGEKTRTFKTVQIIQALNEKLIRRHPHVFGDAKVDGLDALNKQWESIKSKEAAHVHRKSLLDDVAKTLPTLSRAQKMHKKISKVDYKQSPRIFDHPPVNNEEELGTALLELVARAHESGLDAEHALRKKLTYEEKAFRQWEADQ